MRSIYTQAFEGAVCTDSSGSLALLFLIMFAISLIGMMLIMLRASIYPVKMGFPSSSCNEEENELVEYPACLQHVLTLPSIWSDSMDDNFALSTKIILSETSSEATRSCDNLAFGSKPDTFETSDSNTRVIINPEVAFESLSIYDDIDEAEAPNSEDKRKTPHSSPDSKYYSDQSQICTPDAMHTSHGDDDVNCTPVSPRTPSSYSGMRSRRFATPEFLTPGTFRRWRRRDEEAVRTSDEIPETSLMISPTDQNERVGYYSSFLSPLKLGSLQYGPREDKSK
jgi:hypothetical protein